MMGLMALLKKEDTLDLSSLLADDTMRRQSSCYLCIAILGIYSLNLNFFYWSAMVAD